MKIVIAIDSFKGSLEANESGAAVSEGIDAFFPIVRHPCTLGEAMDKKRI